MTAPELTSVDGSVVLLQCDGVCLQRDRREIVHDVSLQLRAGEVTALLGPNGAGKSTLLDGLAGELAVSAGQILRQGRTTLGLQSPVLAHRTVMANMLLALSWWGVPRASRRARALGALQQLGVEHLAKRRATELSGGERRRVHLARSLAVDPDILLLDEPFAGLDGETRASLLEEASSALRSDRRATLVVVHDRDEAWALADRLLILLDGRLVAEGPPHELLDQPPTQRSHASSATTAQSVRTTGSYSHVRRIFGLKRTDRSTRWSSRPSQLRTGCDCDWSLKAAPSTPSSRTPARAAVRPCGYASTAA